MKPLPLCASRGYLGQGYLSWSRSAVLDSGSSTFAEQTQHKTDLECNETFAGRSRKEALIMEELPPQGGTDSCLALVFYVCFLCQERLSLKRAWEHACDCSGSTPPLDVCVFSTRRFRILSLESLLAARLRTLTVWMLSSISSTCTSHCCSHHNM